MNQKKLYITWGALFALCAGFGFIQEPEGLLKAIMVLLAAGFFVVPGILVWKGERRDAQLVRDLSIGSLGLTLVALLVNFLSVQSSQVVGDVMYGILVIVSSPMVCSQYWVVSMFCWAFLMIWAVTKLKNKKSEA